MPEAKISLPRNPMCRRGAAEVSEMCFPKAFTVIIPQMFVVYGISGRYCGTVCFLYGRHCLPNDKSTVFCLPNLVFQIRFFKYYSILYRLVPFSSFTSLTSFSETHLYPLATILSLILVD